MKEVGILSFLHFAKYKHEGSHVIHVCVLSAYLHQCVREMAIHVSAHPKILFFSSFSHHFSLTLEFQTHSLSLIRNRALFSRPKFSFVFFM